MDKIRDLIDGYRSEFSDALFFIIDPRRWLIFIERIAMLAVVAIIAFILWFTIISLVVAPFYSATTGSLQKVVKYELEGETTVRAIQQGIQGILDDTLITNFVGVRNWIDNKPNEQIGMLQIYRVATNALEDDLARNRGTSGASKYLTKARADIYADYDIPIFTSYDTRAKSAIKNFDRYIKQLKEDSSLPMSKKNAVFIVNSDNLALAIDKIKQKLQDNIAPVTEPLGITEVDDRFYKIRGNLIAIHQVLQGIDYDFKDKMIDKSSYKANFIPIMDALERAIEPNPIVVVEFLGHLSRLEKEANIISQKMTELRDKLRKG